MLDQITPVILTRDEAPNIGRTLAQLTWATEIVLVDSFSVDSTVEIARRFPNVRIVQREFDELATQWMFGLRLVRTPWLMALDADYFVPDALVRELEQLTPPPRVRGYRSRFLYAVGGKVLRGSLYPPHIVIAATAHARVWQDGHAQRLVVDGEVGELVAEVIHDDRKTFRAFIERQERYMTREAQKLRTANPLTLGVAGRIRKLVFVAPFAVLVHTLIVKRLILDGLPGLRYVCERFIAELLLSRELLRRTGRTPE